MAEAPPSSHDGPIAVGRSAVLAGAAAATPATFLFRFLTAELTNDHFVHLSRGWQILQGEVPVRDFFDPGLILQYYTSTAALALSGHNLLGEAIVTCLFVAAGAGLAFVEAARLSRSLWIATAATTLVVVSSPRLYNYPKMFFYVLALVAGWHYATRPTRGRAAVLALVTALAFLYRHDHGVYIGVSSAALLAIVHWPDWKTATARLAQYGLVGLLLLAPFLAFVQATAGLPRYVRGISPQADRALSIQFNWLPFAVDTRAPLAVVRPPTARRVNLRWADGIAEADRWRLEARYGLRRPMHEDGSTWSYVLTDESREGIAAVVDDPLVADTHGIDRAGRRIDLDESWVVRLQRAVPLLRARLLPGVFSEGNALAWWYYLTLLLPPAALLLLGALLWRGRIERREAAVVAMTALLGLVAVQTLVRGSPDSRLPDVAGPMAVIGAWMAGRWVHATAMSGRKYARLAPPLAVLLLTAWSIGTNAHIGQGIETSRILTGPAGVWWRLGVVVDRLGERPIANWTADQAGLAGLTRYVFECTAPADRVLVTWFEPRVFFYAERRFAGGQVYLHPNWHASRADQRLTIERLEAQRVPLILEREDQEYEPRFPLVHAWVEEHYEDVPIAAPRMRGYRVRVDRRLTPSGTYEPLGLPCYR
jgi:hypothetical protein